jgi:hypothetical protein
VVSRSKFGRGDIVAVNLDPTEGHEQKGMRPALVLSTNAFNALGVVLVAPITQGGDFARHAGLAASLSGAGTKTQDVALVNHRLDQDAFHIPDEADGASKPAAATRKTPRNVASML